MDALSLAAVAKQAADLLTAILSIQFPVSRIWPCSMTLITEFVALLACFKLLALEYLLWDCTALQRCTCREGRGNR